jgi:hypothetical protein
MHRRPRSPLGDATQWNRGLVGRKRLLRLKECDPRQCRNYEHDLPAAYYLRSHNISVSTRLLAIPSRSGNTVRCVIPRPLSCLTTSALLSVGRSQE